MLWNFLTNNDNKLEDLEKENNINKENNEKLKDENIKLKDENIKLKDENIKLKDENMKLETELNINKEIIESVHNNEDLEKIYKKKIIELNNYKMKTNEKIIKLEEYNKILRTELCELRQKYEKMNRLSNYRKERNEKLEKRDKL